LFAQLPKEAPKKKGVFLPINFSYQLSGGDLSYRFGPNSSLGIGAFWKTGKNWIAGIEGNLMFGRKVRENGIFSNLEDSTGYIVDQNGQEGLVSLSERGYNFYFKAGKILPIFQKNQNSGLLVMIGAGFLQHKIKINTQGNSIPQLSGNYMKGYDRLTNGFSGSQFIGYFYLDNFKLINFYAGVEVSESFTQNRRNLNYNTMTQDTQKRLDFF